METDVQVAWIGAGVAFLVAVLSAIVAIATAALTRRQGQKLEELRYQREAHLRAETELKEAKAVVERLRLPLLASAVELRRRLGNIRSNDFLSYTRGDDHQAIIAVRSTLYRLAAYLGWRECLDRQLTYLQYPSSQETKEVLALLENVATKLSTSEFDWIDGAPRLMLWKDEQRAIGGLMQAPGAGGILGFEVFDSEYETRFSHWFESFARDLRLPDIEHRERIDAVFKGLAELIAKLDEERVYEGRV